MITVHRIATNQELDLAFAIRHKVFVIGQNCPEDEEYDGLDPQCTHLLAFDDHVAIGTCRIRTTEKGIKLERFAVLEEHRGKGAGDLLVRAALAEAKDAPYIYLHSQDHAMGLYERHGFSAEGDAFYEAGIRHFKMVHR